MNDPITHLVEKIIDGNYDLKQKKALLNEVRKIMAPEQNRWNFRYAIWTLALLSLSIPIIILINNRSVPEGLLSLGSAAVGALAAFLTPYAQRSQGRNIPDPISAYDEEIPTPPGNPSASNSTSGTGSSAAPILGDVSSSQSA